MKVSVNKTVKPEGLRHRIATAMAAAAALAGGGLASRRNADKKPLFTEGSFTKVDPQKVQEQIAAMTEVKPSSVPNEQVIEQEIVLDELIVKPEPKATAAPMPKAMPEVHEEETIVSTVEDAFVPVIDDTEMPEAEIIEVTDESEIDPSLYDIEIIEPISYVHVTLDNNDEQSSMPDPEGPFAAQDVSDSEQADVEVVTSDNLASVDDAESPIVELGQLSEEEQMVLHDKIHDAVMSAVEIDPNDIVDVLDYNFDELGVISSDDGENYVAATYHNSEGDLYYLVDTDGDNILDTVYDMDGSIKMVFESSNFTVDDAALLVSNYDDYLPAIDTVDSIMYDMSHDIIDL